jgi:hypothetical protein
VSRGQSVRFSFDTPKRALSLYFPEPSKKVFVRSKEDDPLRQVEEARLPRPQVILDLLLVPEQGVGDLVDPVLGDIAEIGLEEIAQGGHLLEPPVGRPL